MSVHFYRNFYYYRKGLVFLLKNIEKYEKKYKFEHYRWRSEERRVGKEC